MQANRYQDLRAWQRAIELVERIYAVTSKLPQEEMFGLKSQLRRCAVSIPSNIAEGQGRATRGEFQQFLGHARGSLYELETQIVIAAKLGYVRCGRQQFDIGRVARAGTDAERADRFSQIGAASPSTDNQQLTTDNFLWLKTSDT
jgi:four helix bundle protein